MPPSLITFTAIPAGLDGTANHLKLSVYVTPKLVGGVPDCLKDWPHVASRMRFSLWGAIATTDASGVQVADPTSIKKLTQNGQPIALVPSNANLGDQAHSDTYRSIFSNTRVKDYDPKHQDPNTTFKTYDTAAASACIKAVTETFLQFGIEKARQHRNPTHMAEPLVAQKTNRVFLDHVPTKRIDPNYRAAVEAFASGGIADTILARDQRRVWQSVTELNANTNSDLRIGVMRQVDPRGYRNLSPDQAKIKNPLLALRTFWQREQRRAGNVPVAADRNDGSGADPNQFDFHQRWAFLGHHAPLMEYLGITLNFVFERPPDLGKYHVVSVTPADDTMLTPIQSTRGWASFRESSFLPESKDGSIIDGYVDLSKPEFTLETLDLDHSGQNLLQYLESMDHKYNENFALIEKEAIRNPADTLPQPQRTGDIVLVKSGRDLDVHDAVQRNQAAASQKEPVFFAEDLIRGYILDLEASDPSVGQEAKWFSLCARDETYSFSGQTIIKLRGHEGSIKPISLTENLKSEADQKPVPEHYVSEAIVRWRDKLLCTPENASDAIEKTDGRSIEGDANWGPQVTISEPTGIPKPRKYVGARYRIRARVEFLGGSSVPHGSKISRSNGSPVDPPALPQKDPLIFTRAEPLAAPAVLLTRNKFTTSLESKTVEAMVRHMVVTSRDGEHVSSDFAERLIAPPRVGRRVAELHIRKDRAEGIAKGFQRLALKKDDGSLIDPAARFGDDATISYVPDPMAVEVVAILLDRTTGKLIDSPQRAVLYADIGETNVPKGWPDALIHFLVLNTLDAKAAVGTLSIDDTPPVDGNGFARWGSQTFKVGLPPAHQATLRLQAGWGTNGDDRLSLMSLWSETSRHPDLTNEILKWGHPMLTCGTDISLVHAVQYPLRAAEPQLPAAYFGDRDKDVQTTRKMARWKLERKAGENSYHEECAVALDRKSTGQVSIAANSYETRDNGDDSLEQRAVSFPVAKDQVASDESTDHLQPTSGCLKFNLDPRDTKFRRLQLKTIATSRFAKLIAKDETECSIESLTAAVDLPSTAPPEIPHVSYITPTFGWDSSSEKSPKLFWNRRKGAGLRVYLNDRWFSSGDGELLGVVVKQDASVQQACRDKKSSIPFLMPDQLAANNYLSAWGFNPDLPKRTVSTTEQFTLDAWDTVTPELFSGTVPKFDGEEDPGKNEPDGACGWNIVPRGQPNASRVAVVGYKPVWDKNQKLWYADIVFNKAPDYGTFVRLALSRYQPFSLSGLELSSVVLTDFSLLAADRTITIERKRISVVEGKRTVVRDGLAVSIWGLANPTISDDAGLKGAPDFSRPRKNQHVVFLEHKGHAGTRSLGWEPSIVIPDMTQQAAKQECPARGCGSDTLLWYGEIPRQSCVDKMLVAYEYEFTPSDGPEEGRRIFYADALEL